MTLDDITDTKWGAILSLMAFLILILASCVSPPMMVEEPIMLFFFMLIATPIMITLLYRLHKIKKRNEK